jgi:hypothetical protein
MNIGPEYYVQVFHIVLLLPYLSAGHVFEWKVGDGGYAMSLRCAATVHGRANLCSWISVAGMSPNYFDPTLIIYRGGKLL